MGTKIRNKFKTECEHPKEKRKNLTSDYSPYDKSSFITVECQICKYRRYESRYQNGSIHNSLWFRPKR